MLLFKTGKYTKKTNNTRHRQFWRVVGCFECTARARECYRAKSKPQKWKCRKGNAAAKKEKRLKLRIFYKIKNKIYYKHTLNLVILYLIVYTYIYS